MLTTSINVMIGVICCIGMASSLRVNIGYIYLMELTPLSGRTLMGTCWFMLDTMTILVGAIYFMMAEDKSWMALGLSGFVFQVYGCIASMLLRSMAGCPLLDVMLTRADRTTT